MRVGVEVRVRDNVGVIEGDLVTVGVLVEDRELDGVVVEVCEAVGDVTKLI